MTLGTAAHPWYYASMELCSAIDPAIPLLDLHRHLDGNVRLETILDLGQQHGVPLPGDDLTSLRPHVQVTALNSEEGALPGVMAFIARFRWMTAVLVDEDACRRVAFENVVDASEEGLDYVELRFSPWFMAEANSLAPEGVVEAVVDGVQAGAREKRLPVKLIGILSRTYGPQTAWRELHSLLRNRDRIVGLDLAGDEANWPGDLFVEHLRRGRDAGWRITVHAGESAGPDSIWQALQGLGAERIGHAVTAIQDPCLVDALAERQVGIETSLTSNVQTSTVAGYGSHPCRHFVRSGLLVTLNTDDPGISAIDLRHEYEVAAPAAGLTLDEIRQVQRNALQVAFLDPAERTALCHVAAARGTRSAPGAPAQALSHGDISRA